MCVFMCVWNNGGEANDCGPRPTQWSTSYGLSRTNAHKPTRGVCMRPSCVTMLMLDVTMYKCYILSNRLQLPYRCICVWCVCTARRESKRLEVKDKKKEWGKILQRKNERKQTKAKQIFISPTAPALHIQKHSTKAYSCLSCLAYSPGLIKFTFMNAWAP